MPSHTHRNAQIQNRALHKIKYTNHPIRIGEIRTTTPSAFFLCHKGKCRSGAAGGHRNTVTRHQPNSLFTLTPQPATDNQSQSRHSRGGLASTGKPRLATKQTQGLPGGVPGTAGPAGAGPPAGSSAGPAAAGRRHAALKAETAPGEQGPHGPSRTAAGRRLTAANGRLESGWNLNGQRHRRRQAPRRLPGPARPNAVGPLRPALPSPSLAPLRPSSPGRRRLWALGRRLRPPGAGLRTPPCRARRSGTGRRRRGAEGHSGRQWGAGAGRRTAHPLA